MKNRAIGLFDEAIKKLNEADQELSRPEEDVVSYLVCRNAQAAIENFLKGYLLQNGIEPGNSENIQALYEKCMSINPRFKEVDLSEFKCKAYKADSRSCTDTGKVSNCLNIAGDLNLFFRREKIYS